jgi:monothiol glutaredoxin
MKTTAEQLQEMIDNNHALLFMKGTPHHPQCGFSAKVVQALIEVGKPFNYVDVLSDPDIRCTLPSVSEWPTFPQLFVKGELVGGCDIITEMHSLNELAPLFD